MATKLDREIRREIVIDGEPFTVTLTPQGVRITRKRFRSGRILSWRALWERGNRESSSGSDPRPLA